MMFSDGTRLCADEQGEFYTCHDLTVAPVQKTTIDSSLYSAPMNFQLLSEYTEQMAAELQADLGGKKIKGNIVVASFVHLDAALRSTNRVGNQLAEFFIHDLQQIGLPVSEHRLSDEMSINAAGDFALSRDADTLKFDRHVAYVLVGTLLENNRGLIVNTRLVSTRTHEVLASASKLLPTAVIAGL
jgi:TolB-like protein